MPEIYTIPNPDALDPSKYWFVTGLLYSYAGISKSIFDCCPPPSDVDESVVTLMMPGPVYVPHLFTMPIDNWTCTVQGVPIKRSIHFLAQLPSMAFRQQTDNWMVNVKPLSVADQLSPLRSVKLFYLLPVCQNRRLDLGGIVDGRAALLKERHAKGK